MKCAGETLKIHVSPANQNQMEDREGNPVETVGNNNTGENIEAGDESNEREDVREEIKGQRTGLMRG